MSPESSSPHEPDNRRQSAAWRIVRWIDNGFLQWGAAYARGSEAAGASPLPGGNSFRPNVAPLRLTEMDKLDIKLLEHINYPAEFNKMVTGAQTDNEP